MSNKEDYGLEDVCTSLDGIEKQLRRLVECWKSELLSKGRVRFIKFEDVNQI